MENSMSNTFGKKNDMMYDGVDFEYLEKFEEKIVDMKKKMLLPPQYTVHNAIQLIQDSAIDTTNRQIVLDARKDGFDPEGFRSGRPLQKSLFYTNPYITCSWCNSVNYVDVMVIRRMLTLPDELKKQIGYESLPPCQGCGRADGFEVGANDYDDEIKRRALEEERKLKINEKKAVIIQRYYRYHLRVLYGRAFYTKLYARNQLVHRAASMIASIARVRLAKRRLKTERALALIKNAPAPLLQFALKPSPSRSRVWWYSRGVEEKLLFEDYINLASRSGFNPPRFLVERNIVEIAKRIRERENYLIRLVQKRWRGVMTRRIVKLYRKEVFRLRQWQINFVMKIQRLYRGFYCRLHILPKYKKYHEKKSLRSKYVEERNLQKFHQAQANTREKLMALYNRERGMEFTARVTSKIDDMSTSDGKKMQLFKDSCYGDDTVRDEVVHILTTEYKQVGIENTAKDNMRNRKQFLMNRIAETGPKGFGSRAIAHSRLGVNAIPLHKHSSGFLVVTQQNILNEKQIELQKQMEKEKKKSISQVRKINRASSRVLEKSHSMAGIGETESVSISSSVASDQATPENAPYRIFPPSRSRGMSHLFQQELQDIVQVEISNARHTFAKKDLKSEFQAHNSKEGSRLGKSFPYPKDINVDPMKWLSDDIDVTIKFQDKNIRNRNSAAK